MLSVMFLVKYHTKNMLRRVEMNSRDEGAGAVMLYPCLGEVHKDILLWDKRYPMPPGPPQAPLVDSLQCSVVFIC